jgi:hypothetical protein
MAQTLPSSEDLAASVGRQAGTDPVQRLRLAVETAHRLNELSDALVERFVTEARKAGISWAEIGELFGMSKQAAQKRYAAAPTTGGWPGLAPAAQEALNLAGNEARQLGHNHVGTEHALLGLLATDAGMAAHALAGLGVRRDAILAETCLEGAGPLPHDCLGVQPRLKRALELAGRVADGLGHRRANTEHVLAAIVQTPDALATELLRRQGVEPQDVLRELGRRLGVDPEVLVLARRRRRRLRRAAA